MKVGEIVSDLPSEALRILVVLEEIKKADAGTSTK